MVLKLWYVDPCWYLDSGQHRDEYNSIMTFFFQHSKLDFFRWSSDHFLIWSSTKCRDICWWCDVDSVWRWSNTRSTVSFLFCSPGPIYRLLILSFSFLVVTCVNLAILCRNSRNASVLTSSFTLLWFCVRGALLLWTCHLHLWASAQTSIRPPSWQTPLLCPCRVS